MGIRGIEVLTDDIRTDPETCHHNVVFARFTSPLIEPNIECLSCGTNLNDYISRVGKNYQYDASHGWWVHQPKLKE